MTHVIIEKDKPGNPAPVSALSLVKTLSTSVLSDMSSFHAEVQGKVYLDDSGESKTSFFDKVQKLAETVAADETKFVQTEYDALLKESKTLYAKALGEQKSSMKAIRAALPFIGDTKDGEKLLKRISLLKVAHHIGNDTLHQIDGAEKEYIENPDVKLMSEKLGVKDAFFLPPDMDMRTLIHIGSDANGYESLPDNAKKALINFVGGKIPGIGNRYIKLAESANAATIGGTTAQALVPGGGTYTPDFMASLLQQYLYAYSGVIGKLGITRVALSVQTVLPKRISATVAQWYAEGATAAEGNFNMASLKLSPKRVADENSYSWDLQLGYDKIGIESLIRQDLDMAMEQAEEVAVINGSGNNDPLGLFNMSFTDRGISGTPAWKDILNWKAAIKKTNAFSQPGASFKFLGTPDIEAYLGAKGKESSTSSTTYFSGFLMENDAMAGFPVVISNNVPINLGATNNKQGFLLGDFSRIVIGVFGTPFMIVDDLTAFSAGVRKVKVARYMDMINRLLTSFQTMNFTPPTN